LWPSPSIRTNGVIKPKFKNFFNFHFEGGGAK